MTKNSTLMLHKSTVQVGGFVDNAQEALNTFRKLDQKYYEIYASRSKEKIEKIADMAHKDRYFNAEEALEASLIDEII
jgi:ATP-dependent protease ClpP protease subunit